MAVFVDEARLTSENRHIGPAALSAAATGWPVGTPQVATRLALINAGPGQRSS